MVKVRKQKLIIQPKVKKSGQMIINTFIKRAPQITIKNENPRGKYAIYLKKIKQWLSAQGSYSVRIRVFIKLKTGHVIVNGIDDLRDIDLATCESLSTYNYGVRRFASNRCIPNMHVGCALIC